MEPFTKIFSSVVKVHNSSQKTKTEQGFPELYKKYCEILSARLSLCLSLSLLYIKSIKAAQCTMGNKKD